jgi:hypothetical protein
VRFAAMRLNEPVDVRFGSIAAVWHPSAIRKARTLTLDASEQPRPLLPPDTPIKSLRVGLSHLG